MDFKAIYLFSNTIMLMEMRLAYVFQESPKNGIDGKIGYRCFTYGYRTFECLLNRFSLVSNFRTVIFHVEKFLEVLMSTFIQTTAVLYGTCVTCMNFLPMD